MAKPLTAQNSEVGSTSDVYQGRAYSRPIRRIRVVLGERHGWSNGSVVHGDRHAFTFDSVEDARLIANAILAEVKIARAARR